MNIIQKLILFVAIVTGSFVVVGANNTTSALFENAKSDACKGANLSNNRGSCREDAAAASIENTIGFIVNLLTIIVGIAAVIMIIINGFRFVTASGDSNNITAARNGIIYAIVGLIVVALAQIIVRYVINKIN